MVFWRSCTERKGDYVGIDDWWDNCFKPGLKIFVVGFQFIDRGKEGIEGILNFFG